MQQLEKADDSQQVEIRITDKTIAELQELNAPWKDPEDESTREGRG